MKNIYVLGSINMDIVINTPRMPAGGETLTGDGFFLNPGGKGANQAVACAKLGKPTRLIGKVGSDPFGDSLFKTLSGYGVNVDCVRVHEGSGGVAVIIVENGENRIILDGGANREIACPHISEALGGAAEGDLFITQLENNTDAVAYGLKTAKDRGMTTIFNPAPAVPLDKSLLKNADYLVVNESECEILSGIYPDNPDDVVRAYGALGCSFKAFIVTLGSRGSVAYDGREIIKVEAKKIKAVDTTAAGDTFVGALACKLADGAPLKAALGYASLCSALTCTKKGAQQAIPTLSEVEKAERQGL